VMAIARAIRRRLSRDDMVKRVEDTHHYRGSGIKCGRLFGEASIMEFLGLKQFVDRQTNQGGTV
jgi:hypothetical protein